jgi:hypothetical protein
MDNVCTHSLTHSLTHTHSLTQRGCSGEEIWAAFCNEVNLEEKEFFGLQYEPPDNPLTTHCSDTLKMLFPKVTDSHSLPAVGAIGRIADTPRLSGGRTRREAHRWITLSGRLGGWRAPSPSRLP